MRRSAAHLGRTAATAVIAVAALALAGCSGGTAGAGGGPAATVPTSVNTTKAVTITFSWWGNDARAKTTESVIADFEKLHPNITVKAEPSDISSYFDRLATETAAGSAPDVMTLGGAYPLEYGGRGALLDLSSVKTQLDTSKFDQSILSAATYQGKLYGVPTGANAVAVIADPDVFKAAGVAMPNDNTWTWQDYVTIADKITKGSPKGTFGAEDRFYDLMGTYAAQRGTGIFTADGKLAIQASTLSDYWTMEQQMLKGGGMPSASLTQETLTAGPEQTLMGQGKSGMIFAYTNQLSAYSTAAGKKLVLLRVPGETEYTRPGMTLLPSQYYSIYSKSQHPAESAMFIDYLVNSTDAAKKILTDRGLSSNSTVRAAVAPLLTPQDQASAKFVDLIGKDSGPAFPPSPPGASSANDITNKLDSDVLFGRATPAQAAQEWISQMNTALSK